ncbi:MAG: response regulator, partial [Alphaproteobacteria bacterium]
MADYDFERLSVLVVDDSLFLRSLLVNSLRILGVGQVHAVEHGGEAIEFLRRVKTEPMKVGVQEVDIVLSNWQMSPVDGMMLLRFIRR